MRVDRNSFEVTIAMIASMPPSTNPVPSTFLSTQSIEEKNE
jgi:hypothetical protein